MGQVMYSLFCSLFCQYNEKKKKKRGRKRIFYPADCSKLKFFGIGSTFSAATVMVSANEYPEPKTRSPTLYSGTVDLVTMPLNSPPGMNGNGGRIW